MVGYIILRVAVVRAVYEVACVVVVGVEGASVLRAGVVEDKVVGETVDGASVEGACLAGVDDEAPTTATPSPS